VDFHLIAGRQAARRGVRWIEGNALDAGYLVALRQRAHVELAVQAIGGLDRDEMQRVARGCMRAQPFHGSQPRRVRRHIDFRHGRNACAVELDAARRRLQRVRPRVAPKVLHQHKVAIRQRQFDVAFIPERVELRKLYPLAAVDLGAAPVDIAYPREFVTPFSKSCLLAQALREFAENIEVVAGKMLRPYRLLHRQDVAVAR